MSSSPTKGMRSTSPKKQSQNDFNNGRQSPVNEPSQAEQLDVLYRSDQEIIKLSQTYNHLRDKVEDSPSQSELVYQEQFEVIRYQKRQEIKKITEDMSQSSKKHTQQQEKIINQNNDMRQKLQELRKQLASTIKSREDERCQQQEILDSRSTTISIVTKESLQLSTEKRYYEARLRIQDDVEKELAMEKDMMQRLLSAKRILEEELQNASQYIHECEDKVEDATKRSLELLKQLKDAETEIETLKQYIIELKQRIAVYIPVKDDLIDKKLAEYINNYPERSKLKIMFMRESEGIYQFGTKRVYVRVDKDKINIRVGGGYLSIDEFLDQYTPAELEKLERKDPLKKFSEKIAIQKTLVGKELRESSPIRGGESPTHSPTRSPIRQNTAKSPTKRI